MGATQENRHFTLDIATASKVTKVHLQYISELHCNHM